MLDANNNPFGVKDWYRFVDQYAYLLSNKLTIDDVKAALFAAEEKHRQDEEELKLTIDKIRQPYHCPLCSFRLAFTTVNDTPRRQVGGGYTCMWYCTKCDYEHYSTRKITEELQWPELD